MILWKLFALSSCVRCPRTVTKSPACAVFHMIGLTVVQTLNWNTVNLYFSENGCHPVDHGRSIGFLTRSSTPLVSSSFLFEAHAKSFHLVLFFISTPYVSNFDEIDLFIHNLLLLFLFRVEFQNKFYQGTGYKFQPFFFKLILTGQIEE